MSDEKRFPIQGGLTVSWLAAERAYATYAKLFGTSQSLERLGERGGFGLMEFVMLFDDRRFGRDPRPTELRTASALREAGVRPV